MLPHGFTACQFLDRVKYGLVRMERPIEKGVYSNGGGKKTPSPAMSQGTTNLRDLVVGQKRSDACHLQGLPISLEKRPVFYDTAHRTPPANRVYLLTQFLYRHSRCPSSSKSRLNCLS